MATPTVVLRPHRNLIPRGVVAILALTMPVFAVIYWLTVPTGQWPLVLAFQIVIVVLAVLGVIAYFGASIRLDDDGATERGFFGRTSRILPEQVGSILMVDLYQTSTLETQPQLFVSDHEGRLLLRMRGQFWPLESMHQVSDRLDVPITVEPRSLTLSELRRTSPQLLYWFERFPRFRG